MNHTKSNSQAGFSLIELLIVVAVMLILAAVAIPSLLKAKAATQNTSAVASLRAIQQANTLYSSTYNSFAPCLSALGPSGHDSSGVYQPNTNFAAGLIDQQLSGASGGTTTQTTCTPANTTVPNPGDRPGAQDSIKAGFAFAMIPGASDSTGRISTYSVYAWPTSYGSSGTASYYMDADGTIRVNTDSTKTAGPADNPIGG